MLFHALVGEARNAPPQFSFRRSTVPQRAQKAAPIDSDTLGRAGISVAAPGRAVRLKEESAEANAQHEEEETRRRELGFPNTLEVSALSEKAGDPGFSAEGTVLHDGSPRVLAIDGIPVEAQLAGTILYLRNQDEPGVIGQVGSTLGKLGVNIATFALGRREAARGAEAVALVRLDGEVPASILEAIGGIKAITGAKLLRLDGI